MTGAMIWEGGSPASWQMYSPRSVSTGCTPAASSAALSCASSESIDLDLMAFARPCLRQISITSSDAPPPRRAPPPPPPPPPPAHHHPRPAGGGGAGGGPAPPPPPPPPPPQIVE